MCGCVCPLNCARSEVMLDHLANCSPTVVIGVPMLVEILRLSFYGGTYLQRTLSVVSKKGHSVNFFKILAFF